MSQLNNIEPGKAAGDQSLTVTHKSGSTSTLTASLGNIQSTGKANNITTTSFNMPVTSSTNNPAAAATMTSTSTSNLANGVQIQQTSIEETPHKIVYKKIESIIEKMQEDTSGVPIRTVKSFMSKIPSVFTGSDLIQWMNKKLDVEDTCEALHFAHLIASHGYMFPIDDHILTVKNDGTFFRFQVGGTLFSLLLLI